MRKVSLSIAALLLVLGVYAQDAPNRKSVEAGVAAATAKKDLKGKYEEGWNKSTQFGINFNASGFNDTWRSVNSGAVGNSTLGFVLNHKNAYINDKNSWINDFQGQLGFLKPQGGNFNRNVDKLFLNSLYGRQINEKIIGYAELNFISQFLQDEDTEITDMRNLGSAFMSPGYLTVSTGIEYRPLDYLSVKLAPIANKWTFVTNDRVKPTYEGEAYGVDVLAGEKYISEVGSQLTLGFNKEVVKNVNLGFRYNAFKAWRESSGVTNKPIDHRLDLIATATVNKFLNVNFTYIGIGDKDIADGWQSASGLGVGLLVNF
jgi:hypothetical protein